MVIGRNRPDPTKKTRNSARRRPHTPLGEAVGPTTKQCGQLALRVRLKTLLRIAKFSQHEADGRKF